MKILSNERNNVKKSDVGKLMPITQQDNNEDANTIKDEDESLNNILIAKNWITQKNWQDAQGKESIPLVNDFI